MVTETTEKSVCSSSSAVGGDDYDDDGDGKSINLRSADWLCGTLWFGRVLLPLNEFFLANYNLRSEHEILRKGTLPGSHRSQFIVYNEVA